ncbi:MAG TPA: hypothetical protein PLQ67_05850 [Burkholderiaceae bacterium]|nr:hypothetical protein [Burkholderiaceae bacterium]
MKRFILAMLSSFALAHAAFAQSPTPFPADWQSWTSMETTLTSIGALPGCSADVSKLPPIYQKTVEIYCSVKPGGPGKVGVLVKPTIAKEYAARSGKFADGSNMILHLKDMKVLFVTGHKNGAPAYGVFTEDGKDITAASGPLASQTCTTCHTGYQAFCKVGQCGTKK